MRSDEEYIRILELWEVGTPKKRIAIMTGIPRATVRDCINRYGTVVGLARIRAQTPRTPQALRTLRASNFEDNPALFESYVYLLGLYLGDGYINKMPRTYKLRFFLGSVYPNIIESCEDALAILLPRNSVRTFQKSNEACVEVMVMNKFLPDFFPQHGPGRKHERDIVLWEWQQIAVDALPFTFLRGLIFSDGSRTNNIVKGKNYPRYEFCNVSSDIKRLFTETCDQLGIHWRWTSRGRTVQIARRADVAFLDQYIGPK